jgi:hypothetical protein
MTRNLGIRTFAALLSVAATLLFATGLAQAAGGASPASSGSTGGGSTPTPPAAGTATIKIPGLFRIKDDLVTIPHRSTTMRVLVKPFVPGQKVVVKVSVAGKVFKTRTVGIKRSTGGATGWFHLTYGVPKIGRAVVTVTHAATPAQDAFSDRFVYATLNEYVHPGSRGRFVDLLQKRLTELHFYLPRSGVYDLHTELAIDAYHRLLHRGVSQDVDPAMVTDLLDGRGKFHVRFPNQGRHAEGDLSDQILALTDGTKVEMLFPISSGKPSTPTILGSFQVYSRVPGYLPDGMYYSDFFIRGYAIHGYNPAPDYPASHGCMRLPIVDAIPAFNWLAIGDWVDTYYT